MNWIWILIFLIAYLATGIVLGINLLSMKFSDEGFAFFVVVWPIILFAGCLMTIVDYIKKESTIVNDKMAMKKFKKSLEENPEIVDDIDFKK